MLEQPSRGSRNFAKVGFDLIIIKSVRGVSKSNHRFRRLILNLQLDNLNLLAK